MNNDAAKKEGFKSCIWINEEYLVWVKRTKDEVKILLSTGERIDLNPHEELLRIFYKGTAKPLSDVEKTLLEGKKPLSKENKT